MPDPADAPDVAPAPPPFASHPTDFATLLTDAAYSCPIDPPLQLLILRSRLPAVVNKNLAAHKVRQDLKKQRIRVHGAEVTMAKIVSPSFRTSDAKKGGAAPAAAAAAAAAQKERKKKKGMSNRFGEYEGSSDEEESIHSSSTDRRLDEMHDEETRQWSQQKAEAKRARRSAAAAAAASGASSSTANDAGLSDFQKQQLDLANFGVDDDDEGDYMEGGEGDDAEIPLEEEEEVDPDSKASEQERMKLHASMELADRRAYDSMVQHEMNETYGFADSNPRTMLLSRDSMLIKLDLMVSSEQTTGDLRQARCTRFL